MIEIVYDSKLSFSFHCRGRSDISSMQSMGEKHTAWSYKYGKNGFCSFWAVDRIVYTSTLNRKCD